MFFYTHSEILNKDILVRFLYYINLSVQCTMFYTHSEVLNKDILVRFLGL